MPDEAAYEAEGRLNVLSRFIQQFIGSDERDRQTLTAADP
jgi:hypothetical protein